MYLFHLLLKEIGTNITIISDYNVINSIFYLSKINWTTAVAKFIRLLLFMGLRFSVWGFIKTIFESIRNKYFVLSNIIHHWDPGRIKYNFFYCYILF